MAGLGAELLVAGGLATIVFGTLGVLASQGLGRLAGCAVLVSSGTLLAVVGMAGLGGGSADGRGGALLPRRLDAGDQRALPDGRADRARAGRASPAMLTVTAEAYGLGDEDARRGRDRDGVGPALPGATTVLGLCFVACALLLAGLPPLAGFLGKFAMLSAALGSGGLAAGAIAAGRARLHRRCVILSGSRR